MAETKKEGIASELITEETLENIQHVNNPVLDLPSIEKTYLKTVKSFHREGNTFFFSYSKAGVAVKVVADDFIRVRLAPIGVFLDGFSYAIVEQEHHPISYDLPEDEENYHVSTNNVRCTIRKQDFLVSFSDTHGKRMNADYAPMHWEEHVDIGGYYVHCTKTAFEDEVFVGCV